MPHLTIEYSANLDGIADMAGLCARLHGVMMDSGLVELGALRVRARACAHYAVADQVAENAFADMVLRMGRGRSEAQLRDLGAALMQAAEAHFADLLARPHFALSLEIQEIGALSWKTNAIHPRLRAKQEG